MRGNASAIVAVVRVFRGSACPLLARFLHAAAAYLCLLAASPHSENAWGKHAVNSYHATSADGDGSGTAPTMKILLQPTPPSDRALRAQNWLPTPADGSAYKLTVRVYWPSEAVLNGSWGLPPLERLPEPV